MNVLKSWTVGEFLGFPRTSGIACQLQGQLVNPQATTMGFAKAHSAGLGS